MKKLLKAVFVFLSCVTLAFPLAAYAQIDVPYIGSWKNGKPYNTDGQPIDIAEYYGESSGWTYDVSRKEKGEDPYIKLDKNYNIIAHESEKDFDGEAMKNDPTAGQAAVDSTISNSSTDSGAETGTINFKAEVPKAVKGSNVNIVIMGDNDKRYTIILRSVNSYEATETVQSGTYRILSASIDGDVAGEYSPYYNMDVTVEGNSGTSWDFTFESLKDAASSTTSVVPDVKAQGKIVKKRKTNRTAIAVSIVAIAFVIFICAFVYLKRKSENDME